MKNYNHFPNLIFYIWIALASTFLAAEVLTQEQKDNSLLMDNGTNINKTSNDTLMPMPLGNFNSALQRVNINRNPFKEPEKSESSDIEDIYSALIFKGIAKSGNKLTAIIETKDVQKFYEVGDLLDNGFTINSISYEETSVEVSNGSRNYKLILAGLKYEN